MLTGLTRQIRQDDRAGCSRQASEVKVGKARQQDNDSTACVNSVSQASTGFATYFEWASGDHGARILLFPGEHSPKWSGYVWRVDRDLVIGECAEDQPDHEITGTC
eukprot:2885557-Pyramimonas_sp.AAC.1